MALSYIHVTGTMTDFEGDLGAAQVIEAKPNLKFVYVGNQIVTNFDPADSTIAANGTFDVKLVHAPGLKYRLAGPGMPKVILDCDLYAAEAVVEYTTLPFEVTPSAPLDYSSTQHLHQEWSDDISAAASAAAIAGVTPLRDETVTARNEAVQAAGDASQSAISAGESAGVASSAAGVATGAASDASGFAGAASTSAGVAGEHATAASQQADLAIAARQGAEAAAETATADAAAAVELTFPPLIAQHLTANPPSDGREVELQTTATHVQWRYVGDAAWTNLVSLASITGDDGLPVELRTTATHIQWRLVGGTWADLVALSALVGPAGPPNILTKGTVTTGAPGSAADFSITGTAPEQVLNMTIPRGEAGANGQAPILLGSYVHSGNLVAQPTAVDLATGVFTCVGHGLTTGSLVRPRFNTFRNTPLLAVFPGGLTPVDLTVTVLTPDTFTVGISSFTSVATMDLSAWAFERFISANFNFHRVLLASPVVSCRIVSYGINGTRYLKSDGIPGGTDNWITGGVITDRFGSLQLGAASEVLFFTEYSVRWIGANALLNGRKLTIGVSTATANLISNTPMSTSVSSISSPRPPITWVGFDNGRVFNGNTIEVWDR